MHSRILQIRKNEGISQTEFAEKLSLTKNYISLIENGYRVPSDRTIADICRIFKINKDWLLTGEGEIHAPVNRDAEMISFMEDVIKSEEADPRRQLIATLCKLDKDEWELLGKIAQKFSAENKKEDQA